MTEKELKRRVRLLETTNNHWLRAAKKALEGDTRELATRVALAETKPLKIELS